MSKKDWETDGYHDGYPVYCTVNADNVDPDAPESFAEDEIRWAGDVYGYEDTMEDNEE